MARGMSLHIGLNSVSAAHYEGWTGPLNACEADAADMQAIAQAEGYATHVLLTPDATRAAVLDHLDKAARDLVAGDILFVSYSGHGGQLPDENGDEDDAIDETWCLFDGQLCDDELAVAWSKLARGVRVFVLSDSCHSGSVSRYLASPMEGPVGTPRGAPIDVVVRTYRKNRSWYDKLIAAFPSQPPVPQATVRLISGCQDEEVSLDGPFNGRFTATLKRVWNRGGFEGTYASFYDAVVAAMPDDQRPNHSVIGPSDPAFDAQRPFRI